VWAAPADEGDGVAASRQPDALADLADGTDLGVGVLVTRHEQHALLVADVDRQGDVHVGEDDDVFERYEQQRAQGRSSFGWFCIVATTFEPTSVLPGPVDSVAGCPSR
jgi:hypothetical protein